eukprot:9322811-Lingulodinium_polyedra.AAC.1
MPDNLRVLGQCCFKGHRVLSDASPVAWQKWTSVTSQGEPMKADSEEEEEEPLPNDKDPGIKVPLEQLYPWLKDIDQLPFDAS